MEDSPEQLWDFIEARKIHIFPSEKGYWVAFDPQTERLGCAPTPLAAVVKLREELRPT